MIINHPKTKNFLKMDNQNFRTEVFLNNYEKSTDLSEKDVFESWKSNQ